MVNAVCRIKVSSACEVSSFLGDMRNGGYDGQQSTAVVEGPRLKVVKVSQPTKLLVNCVAVYHPKGHCAGLSSKDQFGKLLDRSDTHSSRCPMQ